MKGVRVLVILAFAVLLAWIGWSVVGAAAGKAGPAVGAVYDKQLVTPKLSLEDEPLVRRPAQLRVLVGESKKKARWVKVSPWVYVGCEKGEGWDGKVCGTAKEKAPARSLSLSRRQVALGGLAAAMVLVLLAYARGGSRERS